MISLLTLFYFHRQKIAKKLSKRLRTTQVCILSVAYYSFTFLCSIKKTTAKLVPNVS